MFVRTAFCIALIACGGGSTSNPKTDANMTHMDSGKQIDAALDDFGCGGNTACPMDQACCAMPGATTTFKCVATASCPMADQINCDGPDECGGASPVCCGVYVPNGTGQFPSCGLTSLGATCTSAGMCPSHLGQTCNDTTRVRICHVAGDCAEASANKCCTFTSNGAELTFCTDGTTAALAGATCHP